MSNPFGNFAECKGTVDRQIKSALQKENEQLRGQVKLLRRVLSFVECVYRKNTVAESEPSSVLKEMQDALQATAPKDE